MGNSQESLDDDDVTLRRGRSVRKSTLICSHGFWGMDRGLILLARSKTWCLRLSDWFHCACWTTNIILGGTEMFGVQADVLWSDQMASKLCGHEFLITETLCGDLRACSNQIMPIN